MDAQVAKGFSAALFGQVIGRPFRAILWFSWVHCDAELSEEYDRTQVHTQKTTANTTPAGEKILLQMASSMMTLDLSTIYDLTPIGL